MLAKSFKTWWQKKYNKSYCFSVRINTKLSAFLPWIKALLEVGCDSSFTFYVVSDRHRISLIFFFRNKKCRVVFDPASTVPEVQVAFNFWSKLTIGDRCVVDMSLWCKSPQLWAFAPHIPPQSHPNTEIVERLLTVWPNETKIWRTLVKFSGVMPVEDLFEHLSLIDSRLSLKCLNHGFITKRLNSHWMSFSHSSVQFSTKFNANSLLFGFVHGENCRTLRTLLLLLLSLRWTVLVFSNATNQKWRGLDWFWHNQIYGTFA